MSVFVVVVLASCISDIIYVFIYVYEHIHNIFDKKAILTVNYQCLGKLLLKLMHYKIALLHKKVTYWENNTLAILLRYLFSTELGLLCVFNNKFNNKF